MKKVYRIKLRDADHLQLKFRQKISKKEQLFFDLKIYKSKKRKKQKCEWLKPVAKLIGSIVGIIKRMF